MRILAILALIAVSVFTPSSLIAGEVTGTVTSLLVRQSDGLTYFTVSGTATGKPTCATNSYWIIQDETSEAGKKLYALVMAAKIAEKQINVVGANTCTRWGDGEDVKYVQLR